LQQRSISPLIATPLISVFETAAIKEAAPQFPQHPTLSFNGLVHGVTTCSQVIHTVYCVFAIDFFFTPFNEIGPHLGHSKPLLKLIRPYPYLNIIFSQPIKLIHKGIDSNTPITKPFKKPNSIKVVQQIL
jgi:hypothetical protein